MNVVSRKSQYCFDFTVIGMYTEGCHCYASKNTINFSLYQLVFELSGGGGCVSGKQI
jgi:hypothetical protein